MFSKLAFVATFALLAVATPMPGGGEPASSCSTGPVQCCDSSGTASSPAVAKELGILGVVVQGVDVLVGLTCTPITVIGAGSDACSAQALCCENNSFNGVVAVGCTPVDLSL